MKNNKMHLNLEEMEAVVGGFDRSLSKRDEKSEDGGIIVWVVNKFKELFS